MSADLCLVNIYWGTIECVKWPWHIKNPHVTGDADSKWCMESQGHDMQTLRHLAATLWRGITVSPSFLSCWWLEKWTMTPIITAWCTTVRASPVTVTPAQSRLLAHLESCLKRRSDVNRSNLTPRFRNTNTDTVSVSHGSQNEKCLTHLHEEMNVREPCRSPLPYFSANVVSVGLCPWLVLMKRRGEGETSYTSSRWNARLQEPVAKGRDRPQAWVFQENLTRLYKMQNAASHGGISPFIGPRRDSFVITHAHTHPFPFAVPRAAFLPRLGQSETRRRWRAYQDEKPMWSRRRRMFCNRFCNNLSYIKRVSLSAVLPLHRRCKPIVSTKHRHCHRLCTPPHCHLAGMFSYCDHSSGPHSHTPNWNEHTVFCVPPRLLFLTLHLFGTSIIYTWIEYARSDNEFVIEAL